MPLYMKITPLTVYQTENNIFDGLISALPTLNFPRADEYEDLYIGEWSLDSNTLINNLLLETANLNVIYTNPAILRYAISTWAAKEKHIWQSLFETMFYRYNPIWNKDGTYKETATETRNLLSGLTRSITNSKTGTIDETEELEKSYRNADDKWLTDDNTNTKNLTDSNSGKLTTTDKKDESIVNTGYTDNTGTVKNTGTEDNTNSVSAYNSTGFSNRDKNLRTDDLTRTDNLRRTDNLQEDYDTDNITEETDTRSIAHTGTDINNRVIHENISYHITGSDDTTKSTNTSESETGSITDSGTNTGTVGNIIEKRDFGNIGVTKTQEMIRDEREIVKFNIYDYIIDSFKHRFCIMLY